MQCSSYPHKTLTGLPAPAQIALVVALLRAKPGHLSVADFIFRLRKVADGPIARSSTLTLAPENKLDETAVLGEAEYAKLRSDNEKLQAKIIELEHELKQNVTEGRQSLSVRQVLQTTLAIPNTRSKRVPVANAEPDTIPNSEYVDVAEHDPNVQLSASEGSSVRQAWINLQQCLASGDRSSQTLHDSITMLCRTAAGYVRALLENPERRGEQSPIFKANLQRLCGIVKDSAKMIAKGLSVIGNQERMCRSVASEFVNPFALTLGLLHAYVYSFTASTAPAVRKRRKTGRRASVVPSQEPLASSAEASLNCRCLATMLASFFTALDQRNASHRPLIEGLISALFDHVGSCTSYLVFSDSAALSAASGSTGVLPPRGLEDAAGRDPGVTTQTILNELPYLLAVAGEALKLLDLDSPSIEDDSMNDTKRKVQNTLMRGFFGHGDAAFADSFARADAIDPNFTSSGKGPVDDIGAKKGWLLGQIWDLVGWDVLSPDSKPF